MFASAHRPVGGGALDKEWQPGAVRKLFDKEIDNHHEEALLAAQLAAWQLRSLIGGLEGDVLADLKAAMVTWLLQVMQVTCPSMTAFQLSNFSIRETDFPKHAQFNIALFLFWRSSPVWALILWMIKDVRGTGIRSEV